MIFKNSGDLEADHWELEWVSTTPGKRESRRYVGDHILTQHDVRAEGRFKDLIAYGGWSMDDHNPLGFESTEEPTAYHTALSPYGIPYRCLYSKNIDNLMFAGRNISATHTAMASTRVMATCGIIGQAVGTAVSIAIANDLTPRGVYQYKISELQQTLMWDDCYLPFHKLEMPHIMENATLHASRGEVSLLTDGVERQVGDTDHAWEGEFGDEITLFFTNPTEVQEIRLAFDSDLDRISMGDFKDFGIPRFGIKYFFYRNENSQRIPATIIKDFKIYGDEGDGCWKLLYEIKDNYQRLVICPLQRCFQNIKVVPESGWGSQKARIYGVYVR